MTKEEYLEKAFELLNKGKISAEAYDSIISNIDIFTEKEN